MKPGFYLKPHAEVDYKWIKDLSVKGKGTQFIEERIGQHLCDLETESPLKQNSKAQNIR